jgi:hypothetical protein
MSIENSMMKSIMNDINECVEKYIDVISQKYNIPKRELLDMWNNNNGISINLSIPIYNINKIIKIQSCFRGYIIRQKRLPCVLYSIQIYLKTKQFKFDKKNQDGRINSCNDENNIIKILIEKFGNRIKKPEKIRFWYDILVKDYRYGWIPVNIKTTTTETSDNTGNLAMCVYAYTDHPLEIFNTSYENGKMAGILFDKIKNNELNNNSKRDYYFIVINKADSRDVIVNSVKGISILTPNTNNLPFQVCWKYNRIFHYENIKVKLRLFINCLKKPKLNWKETFMSNIRTIKL